MSDGALLGGKALVSYMYCLTMIRAVLTIDR
jgi:hypothetical protein